MEEIINLFLLKIEKNLKFLKVKYILYELKI